jgi:tartrate-resistant acid phosphatase type 5
MAVLLVASLALAGCPFLPSAVKPTQMEMFPPVYRPEQPIARSNIQYRHIGVGQQLQFDASQSTGAQSYRWQVVQAPASSAATFSPPDRTMSQFTIDKAGRYELRLTVRDAAGREDHFDILVSTVLSDLPSVRFIALGDAGDGKAGQYRVADGMKQVCAMKGCDFAIGVGDNIYPRGVQSIKDERFDKDFETPYAQLDFPFYLVLGNRDTSGVRNGDGVYNYRGDIEVAYSKWKKKPSFRWQMPARYYHIGAPVEQPQSQPLVDLYALDTTPLMSIADLPGYELHNIYERQSRWLASEKANSRAPWHIAFTHHPYRSNGTHGDAGNYDGLGGIGNSDKLQRLAGKYVKQLVEEQVCGDMDLFIAGHDHSLQYLRPLPECGGTEFIVSGAGGRRDGRGAGETPAYWQQYDVNGFFHIAVVGDSLTVTAYTVDENGQLQERYSRTRNK